MASALVGLGGNLGDVLACFRRAISVLATLPSTRVVKVARAYRTRALMADASHAPGPDYWNTAVELATTLSPHQLLTHLQAIEADAGRVRRQRWEARPLDLDLLYYDDHVIDDAQLTLPHPHAMARLFVVAPLADIAPERVAGGRTFSERVGDFDSNDLREIRDAWF
ncbi:MAG: 2-amino-4-hydroxy-6-hydroxymethyldihydropteridine diphosphokinase [Myxococcota bacterium]|nr:2-amino-4-hydroxy-6-hydroxymethyldihydropteridine diphosphokinase [Myxococcota bacterium]